MTQAVQRKTSLQGWIAGAMNDTDYEKSCDRIVLVHVTLGGTETEVKLAKIGQGRAWSPESLADFFWNTAQTYCQDLPNAQTFRLLAFFGSAEPRLRHPFMVAGQFDNHGLGTEPPTPEGQKMQGMRHNEALMTGLFNERMAVLEMPLRTIRAMSDYQGMLMKDLHETRSENADFVRVMKEILFEEASKRLDRDLAVRKFERDSRDREMIVKLLPIALNELTGREVVPQSTADSMLIEALADGLDENAVQKIMESGAIPPELMGILMSRMRKALEAKRKRHEDALARGNEAEQDAHDDPRLPAKGETGGTADGRH
jgi:hypothetical protein